MFSPVTPLMPEEQEKGIDKIRNSRCRSTKMKLMKVLKKNLFLILTVTAAIIGVTAGIALRPAHLSSQVIMVIGLPGVLFMNMLKAMLTPLVLICLVSSITKLDSSSSSRLAISTTLFLILSSLYAVMLGSGLAMLIHPGNPSIKPSQSTPTANDTTGSALDSFTDMFRNAFTENLVHSTFAQQKTTEQWSDTANKYVSKLVWVDGINILGLISFAIVMAATISQLGEQTKILVDFFSAMDKVIIRIMTYIIWYGIVAIPSLIASQLLDIADLAATFQTLGMLIVTMLAGSAITVFFTIPLVLWVITRRNPFRMLLILVKSMINIFVTSSVIGALPITLEGMEEFGLDPVFNKTILTMMTMLSALGAALYMGVAPVFIAQINNMPMDISQLCILWVIGTAASIGCSVPGAAIVTMIAVLSALGLPDSDMSLILSIEWIIVRDRAVLSMLGQAVGTVLIHDICGAEKKNDMQKESTDASLETCCESVLSNLELGKAPLYAESTSDESV